MKPITGISRVPLIRAPRARLRSVLRTYFVDFGKAGIVPPLPPTPRLSTLGGFLPDLNLRRRSSVAELMWCSRVRYRAVRPAHAWLIQKLPCGGTLIFFLRLGE